MTTELKEWPLWEIFIRSKQGLEHKHCGSLHASDSQHALQMARDVYTRRQEGVSIWVVPSKSITASAPEDKDAFNQNVPARDRELFTDKVVKLLVSKGPSKPTSASGSPLRMASSARSIIRA